MMPLPLPLVADSSWSFYFPVVTVPDARGGCLGSRATGVLWCKWCKMEDGPGAVMTLLQRT